MSDPTLSDRLALALCVSINGAAGCPIGPCGECRRRSAGVAHEIANWLRERHGGASTTADTLYAVGCHQPNTEPSIQDEWKALERTQDLRMWPSIDPGQEAAAMAVARELRRPDV
jgi:hypothetical protein